MPYLLSFIVTLAALGVAGPAALAQDGAVASPAVPPAAGGIAFSIAPEPWDDAAVTERGYFVYELAAGDEASGSALLRNTGAEPVTIALAAVDATTAQAGGSAFAAVDAGPTAAGAWLTLDESRVTLGPGERASVGFTVRLPREVAPGQYLAGLAAYIPATAEGLAATDGATQAGAAVVMQTRYVIGVQVDVPGDVTSSLTITGVSALEQPSGTKVGIALRNDGDTFLRPEGSVTLRDGERSPILTESIQLGTFLPGTAITYPLTWPGAPAAGEYGVDVEMRYAEDDVARYSGTLTVSAAAPAIRPAPQVPPAETPPITAPATVPESSPIQPWILYGVGGLLLVVILLALLLLRGRRSRSDW